MNLTITDIKEDIGVFKARIQAARDKLDMLPGGHLPYQAYKKREQQQRLLHDEINHLQRLIGYAEEAL